MNHDVYNEITFYERFRNDLREAKALVLIQSPFLGNNRISLIENDLRACLKRGVRICIYVSEPFEHASRTDLRAQEFQQNIAYLQNMGVHVTLKPSIHAKVAVIDGEILWEGSLNILSHISTHERMTRWVDERVALQAVLFQEMHKCAECASLRLFFEHDNAALRREIGVLLTRARLGMGLTQRELATVTGMDQKLISQVEHGKRNLRLSTLLSLSHAVGIHVMLAPWSHAPFIEDLLKKHYERLPIVDRRERKFNIPGVTVSKEGEAPAQEADTSGSGFGVAFVRAIAPWIEKRLDFSPVKQESAITVAVESTPVVKETAETDLTQAAPLLSPVTDSLA